MVMKVLRDGAFGGFLKYVLMSLLALSVLGLVFMDVRGVLQGNIGRTDVASVGNHMIGLRDFDRLARMNLSRYQLTPQQSFQKDPSILMDILRGEIRSTQILLESEDLGLNVNQKKLQQELIGRIKPSQQEGETLQQTLERILRSQGISESDFLKNYNREVIGDVMIESVQSGFESSPIDLASDLYRLQNHSRQLEIISFADSDITDYEKPDDEKLLKIYESTKALKYKIDERRVFQIAYIDDSKLQQTLDVPEESMRQYYDNNIEEYQVPEQRVLEQVIVPNEEEAVKILKLVKDEKLDLAEAKKRVLPDQGTYIPPAPFSDDMLLADIQEGVKKIKAGETAGPFKTVIGYHLITVKDINEPRTQSYEEVKSSIREELKKTELAENMVEFADTLEDTLSGGSSFESASQSIPLIINSFEPFTSTGLDAKGVDVFKDKSEQDTQDKDIILQEGFLMQSGETSRVFEMPSGRFAALRLDEIIPESFKTFEEIKEQLSQQVIDDLKHAKNSEKVIAYKKALESGEQKMPDLAKKTHKEIQTLKNVMLYGPLDSPLSDEHRAAIFQAQVGDILTLSFKGGIILAVIKGVSIPEISKEIAEQIDKIQEQVSDEFRSEIFAYYVHAVGKRHPALVNHDLIEKFYGSSTVNGQ